MPVLPVDPFMIAQRLGIKAYTANLDERVSGMLVKRPGEDPEIYVNDSDSPNRQRFTCAATPSFFSPCISSTASLGIRRLAAKRLA